MVEADAEVEGRFEVFLDLGSRVAATLSPQKPETTFIHR